MASLWSCLPLSHKACAETVGGAPPLRLAAVPAVIRALPAAAGLPAHLRGTSQAALMSRQSTAGLRKMTSTCCRCRLCHLLHSYASSWHWLATSFFTNGMLSLAAMQTPR